MKGCKVNACGINGCIKKHNRLLHSENQMDEGNHAVNVSAATINPSNEVTSFLQIVPVSIQSGDNRLNTYTFLDSGSAVSFIDQSVQEKEVTSQRHRCDAQRSWHTRNEGSEDRKVSS